MDNAKTKDNKTLLNWFHTGDSQDYDSIDSEYAAAIAAASFAIHSFEEKTSSQHQKNQKPRAAGNSRRTRIMSLADKTPSFARPASRPRDAYANQSLSIHASGNTKVDAWEKAELLKIEKRYEKSNLTILEWENEKKARAKRRVEEKKKELDQRRSMNWQHYQNKLARIDHVAGGARSQTEDKKKHDEKKVKERAREMRSLGVSSPRYCFFYTYSEIEEVVRSVELPGDFVFRLSDYGVAEITWENGQPAMHGLGRANETLESIVHQATTCYNQSQNQEIDLQQSQSVPRSRTNVASSNAKWGDSAGQSYLKKRPRSSAIFHDQCVRNLGTASLQEDNISNGATINSKHNDTTMMTWPSFDSPNQSLKSKNTDDDSAYQYGSENQEEECRNENETVRSQSSRRSRAAAIHNQTERRRRERINQKMKALQKLVPNANKTDKASMLDEVIDYLKKLQAQVQLMKNMPIPPPQMMIQLQQQQQQQQQQQLQMSMLARMGMGFSLQMGMPGVMPPTPSHHPFMVPQTMISPAHVGATSQTIHTRPSTNTTTPFSDPHSAFLAQHMNMDMYHNMAAFYRQQVNQGKSMGTSSSKSDHIRGE
ncbi:hypothetical protein L6452_06963 [Arctium lappa]|uniref:Uncharacterized protein n=1 Tax=Arctium lappa TaxID=4217 RepID=A0ACB9EKP2_ARCLA|nr:hypothetical protein L6452_06963 [Arctium lappa]